MKTLNKDITKDLIAVGSKRSHAFNFAMERTLLFWNENIAYTFIPKNACSSLRLTLAISNGLINSTKEHDFIHHNNNIFVPSLKEAFEASSSFVVLRDPVDRVISVYLDKFISKDLPAFHFCKHQNIDIDDLTFLEFCKRIHNDANSLYLNPHWIPQNKFLLFEKESYTKVFNFNQLSELNDWLKEKNITFEDARPLTQHGTDSFAKESITCAYNQTIKELSSLKKEGSLPKKEDMLSDEILSFLKKAYIGDYALLDM